MGSFCALFFFSFADPGHVFGGKVANHIQGLSGGPSGDAPPFRGM